MNASQPWGNRQASQRGISLVELMIGLVISLVLTGAVSLLFIDASRNHRMNENISRMQESSRFSIDKIGRDARGAGYFGCSGRAPYSEAAYLYRFATAVEAFSVPSDAWPADLASAFEPLKAIDEFTNEATDSPLKPKSGSHILALRGIPEGGAIVPYEAKGGALQVASTSAIGMSDIVLVSNCRSSEVCQVTEVKLTADNQLKNLIHGAKGGVASCNEKQADSGTLLTGEVMQIATSTYFVANDPLTERPTLYRRIADRDVHAIARNVDNMRILAGIDEDGDRQIEQFIEDLSAVDWAKVRAIRIVLTLLSEDTGLAVNGADIRTDGRLQYTTTNTIALRNRLP